METIHLKSVDPISQDLLRLAAQNGIDLNWERYEKLQPQDGFLRMGLSCPFGCLQGPCRIDPFERGPQKGLCGMGRDQMVTALILRITWQGMMEISSGKMPMDGGSFPADDLIDKSLDTYGGMTASVQEVYQSVFHLGSSHQSPEGTLLQALRLGILSLGRVNSANSKADLNPSINAGYGLLAEAGTVIGISGYPDAELIKKVFSAMTQASSLPVQLVSLGDWIIDDTGFVPIACTSGEAELLTSAGCIDLLVTGPSVEAGLVDLCSTLNIPTIATGDEEQLNKTIKLACEHSEKRSRTDFQPDASLVGEGTVSGISELEQAFKDMGDKRLALVGGPDTPHISFGWIPVELSKALAGLDIQVSAWGDAALWMIKDGLTSTENPSAAFILDPFEGPMQAVRTLRSANKLKNLKGVCFTGLKGCGDFAVALGLAGLGLDVCVASPIPLWGSESVRNLLKEILSESGGSLHHFDHPPHAQEILDWFTEK
jgi:hypothetical protein